MNQDFNEILKTVKVVLAFPLSFLATAHPRESPKLYILRSLLSCKFTQGPYPGGLNSKLGKSQGLNRSPSIRVQKLCKYRLRVWT